MIQCYVRLLYHFYLFKSRQLQCFWQITAICAKQRQFEPLFCNQRLFQLFDFYIFQSDNSAKLQCKLIAKAHTVACVRPHSGAAVLKVHAHGRLPTVVRKDFLHAAKLALVGQADIERTAHGVCTLPCAVCRKERKADGFVALFYLCGYAERRPVL